MPSADWDGAAFKKRLAKLPRVLRKALREADETNAEEWVRGAKALVPVADEEGGQLRDSIRRYATETGGQIVRAGGRGTIRQTKRGPVDYSRFVEFGSEGQAARPFFWPVYRSNRKRFNARRRRALAKALKEMKE